MARDKEDFARRWSRLKHKAAEDKRAATATPAADAGSQQPAAQLPSIDSLTFESDFKDFMSSRVKEDVKRAALKKLFSDPRFNVIDPLDIDIDDYSNLERIPEATAAALAHAKRALFGPPIEEKDAQDGPKEDLAEESSPAEQVQAKGTDTEDEPKG